MPSFFGVTLLVRHVFMGTHAFVFFAIYVDVATAHFLYPFYCVGFVYLGQSFIHLHFDGCAGYKIVG